MPQVDAYPPPLARWVAVVILMLAIQLSFTDRLIINLFVDDIRKTMALDDLAISLILGGGFAAIYALAGIPVGRAADTHNRRNIILAGMVIWSLGTVACGLANEFGELFLARVFVGLGEATLLPAAVSLIADSFPLQQRGRALGLFVTGGVLGSGIAFGMGGLLVEWLARGGGEAIPVIGALAGWRKIMVLAGLPGLPLAILMVLLVKEPSRKGSMGDVPTYGTVFHAIRSNNGRVLRICLATGTIAAGDYGIMSWLPTLMVRSNAMTTSEIGYILALILIIAGVTACLAGGWISDLLTIRFGPGARLQSMTASYLLCLSGGALLFAPSASVKLIGVTLWFLGSVAGGVVGYAALQDAVPNEMRGTVTALSYISSAIIGIGGGTVAGHSVRARGRRNRGWPGLHVHPFRCSGDRASDRDGAATRYCSRQARLNPPDVRHCSPL